MILVENIKAVAAYIFEKFKEPLRVRSLSERECHPHF